MILAGDIGGTKTNLGLYRTGEGRPNAVEKATYHSSDWPGLGPVVADFLRRHETGVDAACFGVAGPVVDQRARTPNLAWEIDAAGLSRSSGIGRVLLLNDLEATAEGIPVLREDEVVVLAEGESDDTANAALIAPGTGLGMCVVSRAGGAWVPMPGEGGHQTFAPRDEEEERLRHFLARRFGHVSIERVASGPGLQNVFDFLVDSEGLVPAEGVVDRMRTGDPSAVISAAAMDRSCPVSMRALERFLSVLGAAAGDLALVALARSGVWIGGGIAPKILPALLDGTFLEGFFAKGRMRDLVSRIPVRVIGNPETALIGAARRAEQLSGKGAGRA